MRRRRRRESALLLVARGEAEEEGKVTKSQCYGAGMESCGLGKGYSFLFPYCARTVYSRTVGHKVLVLLEEERRTRSVLMRSVLLLVLCYRTPRCTRDMVRRGGDGESLSPPRHSNVIFQELGYLANTVLALLGNRNMAPVSWPD